jgi:hypothetical protein
MMTTTTFFTQEVGPKKRQFDVFLGKRRKPRQKGSKRPDGQKTSKNPKNVKKTTNSKKHVYKTGGHTCRNVNRLNEKTTIPNNIVRPEIWVTFWTSLSTFSIPLWVQLVVDSPWKL